MDKFWSINWEIYFTNYNVYNYSRYSHWFINEIVQKKLIKFKKKKSETYWIKAVSKSNMKDQF